MGAPESGLEAAQQPTAESLLTAFRTIKDSERGKHGQVLDYWLSIRGDKEFPPLHDLDPLEMSDAAPSSILFELIGGGQDAEIRHLGDALKGDVTVERVIDAPNPSLLSSIARKLPIVAISREFLSYEEHFTCPEGLTRCWVTLLPLSSCGSWVDYVYAFVSLEKASAKAAKAEPVETIEAPAEEMEPAEAGPEETPQLSGDTPLDEPQAATDATAEVPDAEPAPIQDDAQEEEPVASVEAAVEEAVEAAPAEAEPEPEAAVQAEPNTEQQSEPAAKGGPGFSKILDGLASLTGFYGQGIKVEDPVIEVDMPANQPAAAKLPPVAPEPAETADEPLELIEAAEEPLELAEVAAEQADPEPVAEPLDEPVAEQAPEPLELAPVMEGQLQTKLTEVRAKADEARQAALRATAALHEGLSAAYDFALDAETSPEEYLRLVEAEGLKIQLRAPMAPVARLAFDGLVDPATLGQCEKILAWALKEELSRGELLERIGRAGGIAELAGEVAKAA